MNKKFTPIKLVVAVDEETIKGHMEGETTYEDKAVLEINVESNELTVCKSYKRTFKDKCLNCDEYGICPVYIRR